MWFCEPLSSRKFRNNISKHNSILFEAEVVVRGKWCWTRVSVSLIKTGGRAGEGGSTGAPRRRSGPSSHPHSRLRTTGRHRGQWRARNTRGVSRGWLRGSGGDHRSAMGGQPQDAGPQIYQHFPSPLGADWRSVDVADRLARNGRDGRVFHVARLGEAFRALSRRFATTSGFANPLPVSCRHLYVLYFLIRWAF